MRFARSWVQVSICERLRCNKHSAYRQRYHRSPASMSTLLRSASFKVSIGFACLVRRSGHSREHGKSLCLWIGGLATKIKFSFRAAS